MSISLIEIPIRDARRTLVCIGSGQNICHIVGPSSFYLRPLIYAGLTEKFTFTSCDPLWTDNDSNEETHTLESMIALEHEIIQTIKERFKQPKIGMLGFSAPACVATSYVMQHPEDISWLKLSGIPIQGTDSNFSASDDSFKQFAEKQSVQNFFLDQDSLRHDTQSFYTYQPSNRQALSENTQAHYKWLKETMAIYHKAFFLDKIQYKYAYFEHWKTNILGLEMNQKSRKHFFDAILDKIDTLSNIKSIANQIPIQIFNGEEDYITPMNAEIAETLSNMQSIQLINYKQCGHCPYIEKPDAFYNDFLTN